MLDIVADVVVDVRNLGDVEHHLNSCDAFGGRDPKKKLELDHLSGVLADVAEVALELEPSSLRQLPRLVQVQSAALNFDAFFAVLHCSS